MLIYLSLLIITIPAVFSLFNPWYFAMHDFQHIARLFLLDSGIHQGILFPRWVDMLGFNFGYPIFNFYPPLIYYLAELFRLSGISYIWSIKSMIILGYFVGASGMFLLVNQLTKRRLAGIAGSALFTFFTYHAVLVYVRGAFAEFWGMNILPYAFLSLELLREKASIWRAVFFGLSLALLILSHVFIAFPFILFGAVYVLSTVFEVNKKLRYLTTTTLGGLFGLGLSAFFWMPSMLERKFTLVDRILTHELAAYSIHFLQPSQLWFSPWGYGGSGPGLSDGMSFQLGKIQIVLAMVSFALFGVLWAQKKLSRLDISRYAIYTLLLGLSVTLTTEYSKVLWTGISQLQYLQFPWRLLSFAGVFIAVLGGYGYHFAVQLFERARWSKVAQWILMVVIAGGVAVQYSKYFRPEKYLMVTDQQLTSFEEIAWHVSSSSFEFSPLGVPLKKSLYDTSIFDIDQSGIPNTEYRIPNTKAEIKQDKNNFNLKVFNIESSQPIEFQLNTFNFPGWTAYLDSQKTTIKDANRYKLITVRVPAGQHQLRFVFEDTPVRQLANTISMVSFGGVVLLLGVGKLKKREA